MRVRRRAAGWAVGLLATGIALSAAHTAGAADPPPTLPAIVQPVFGNAATIEHLLLGDRRGIVTANGDRDNAPYTFTPVDGRPAFRLPAGDQPVSLVGDQLVVWVASPGQCCVGEYDALDVSASPPVSTYLATEQPPSVDGFDGRDRLTQFVTGTGTGWLDISRAGPYAFTLNLHQGGGTTPLHTFSFDAATLPSMRIAANADDTGAALILDSDNYSTAAETAYYVDFAAAEVDGTAGWSAFHELGHAAPALAAGRLAYVADDGDGSTSVVSVTRGAGLGTPRTLTSFPAGVDVEAVAANGPSTAWAVERPVVRDVESHEVRAADVSTMADDASPPVTVAVPTQLEVDDGQAAVSPAGQGFAAEFGNVATTRGAYLVTPGQASLGTDLAPTGALLPRSIDAGPGTLDVVGADANPSSGLPEGQNFFVDAADPGTVSSPVSEPSDQGECWCGIGVADDTKLLGSVSGNRRVYLSHGRDVSTEDDNCYADLQQEGRTVRRILAPSGCTNVSLSGDRLLLGEEAVPRYPLIITPSGPDVSELYDLDAGTVTAEPGDGVLWGDRIAYADASGSVFVRDLARPASPDVRVGSLGGATHTPLQLHGDWVAWTSDDETDNNGTTTRQTTTVAHLTALDTVDRTLTLTLPRPFPSAQRDVLLGDGVLAYLPPGVPQIAAEPLAIAEDDSVHVVDLDTSLPGLLTDTVVGQAHLDNGSPSLALNDETVDYIAENGTVHVVPLPFAADAGPRLTSSAPTGATISPAHPLFAPTLDASRPLAGWIFTVTDASGAVVRTQTGTAPDGAIDASWDGRLPSGQPASSGAYSYRLAGVGIGVSGPLTDPEGLSPLISGSLLVRSVGATAATAPAPTVNPAPAPPTSTSPAAPASPAEPASLAAPAVIAAAAPGAAALVLPSHPSDTGGTPAFPVSWHSPHATTYDVSVSAGSVDGAGRVSWTAPRPWLTGTTLTSATYRGRPLAAAQGQELRFTVTPYGSGISGRPASGVVAVPVDDGSSALRFSGWARHSDAAAWLSGTHRSTKAGATVTLTTGADGLQLLGQKCSGCGRIQVVVDGRVAATVDTSGRSAARTVLATVPLSRRTGRHRVVLRAVSGRPVTLDGVVLTF